MKHKCLGAALLGTFVLVGAQAQVATPAADAASAAAPADPVPAVVVNFGLTTNYKFRGQDQGKNRIAVFGGFDYALPYGFYIGNWNSSINFDPHASIEMDFYGGYKGAITPDLTYDLGILQYFYPQNGDEYVGHPKVHLDTTELYAAISYSIATLKYSGTVSNDYFGFGQFAKLINNPPTFTGDAKGRYTGYYDLSANYEVVKGLTLNGHIGYTRFSSDLRDSAVNAAKNYTDYKLGATYDLGAGFAGAAALVGATERNFYGSINNPKVILTISKSM